MTENKALSVASANGATHSKSTNIPKRRGSEYVDVLLRNLDESIFKQPGSAIIGLSGCAGNQGQTTTAINLGIRSADHGMGPVLLIDANAKNGKLSRMYRAGRVGYGDCVSGSATLKEAVTATKIQSLDILGIGNKQLAGQIVPDPEIANKFFADVREQYRFTIIDMPIFKNPSSAHAISSYVDGLVVVARSGIHSSKLADMQESISLINDNLLGVVVTGGEGSALPRWLQRLFD